MSAAARTPVNLMFRAFSDPIRLRILNLVVSGELCVCDLVAAMELPQPTVSRHLSYLRRAGLLSVREERSWNFYELAPARTAVHSKILECLDVCVREVPEVAGDLARLAEIRRSGGCCPP